MSDLADDFDGACFAVEGHVLAIELLKLVLLHPVALSGIPRFEDFVSRHVRLRALAFSRDAARLYLDEVIWDAWQPHIMVERRGALLWRVTVSGHPVYLHSRCARELTVLWRRPEDAT
jgi:hypothetical protein